MPILPILSYGTGLAQRERDTNAARAAAQRWLHRAQSMAKPHDTRNQEAFQEHPLVTELLAALPAIEENARVEVRLYTVMDWVSQNET
jgi:hypothetical protein